LREFEGCSDENAKRVRERILQAFSEKAKRPGLRSVVMAELASELRMSATTLYKHLSSKEELVLVLVECWVMEVAAAEAVTSERPELLTPLDRVRHWAEVKLADRTGASRSEAIQTAVSVWASGAVAP
jgi:AcrR family transcriptional regulator